MSITGRYARNGDANMHTYKAIIKDGSFIEQDRKQMGKSFLDAAIAFTFMHVCRDLAAGDFSITHIYRDGHLIASVGFFVHQSEYSCRVYADVELISLTGNKRKTAHLREMTIGE